MNERQHCTFVQAGRGGAAGRRADKIGRREFLGMSAAAAAALALAGAPQEAAGRGEGFPEVPGLMPSREALAILWPGSDDDTEGDDE